MSLYSPDLDPAWLRELAVFIKQQQNKRGFEKVRQDFVNIYLDYVRSGIHPRAALKKAQEITKYLL